MQGPSLDLYRDDTLVTTLKMSGGGVWTVGRSLESDASRALLDLYQLPELEALACRFLQTDAVDLMSCHTMLKRPEGPGDAVSTVGSGQIPGRLGWHGARPTPPSPSRPTAC